MAPRARAAPAAPGGIWYVRSMLVSPRCRAASISRLCDWDNWPKPALSSSTRESSRPGVAARASASWAIRAELAQQAVGVLLGALPDAERQLQKVDPHEFLGHRPSAGGGFTAARYRLAEDL